MIDPRFYWAFLAISSLFILLRGGAPERVGIGIAIAASVLSFLAGTLEGRAFASPEISVLIVDLAVLAAFALLALKADRFWPIAAASLQVAGVASHFAAAASSGVIAWVYSIGQALWAYPIILLIVWGTVRHRRRLSRSGADRSWSASSSTSQAVTPNDGPAA